MAFIAFLTFQTIPDSPPPVHPTQEGHLLENQLPNPAQIGLALESLLDDKRKPHRRAAGELAPCQATEVV
ncbi:hypothetical protein HBI24_238870 [Parastagonospora nodorum]|nr:hypothetical protein HBH51_229070 [Parastagonospora nodorum]KAH3959443.1 hypothetical protein HBH52_243240 [Parastagonospora nodorum]KAH4043013.1 hypothetical protein HBH49_240630 [Parastagonospora nodorum]KAH4061792.1 hypothetical protein HBH50_215010 [Parastagonospora nodorum]KAH4080938.1 hypothetical protein HBH48_203980 [Parastagonospora nodorum]